MSNSKLVRDGEFRVTFLPGGALKARCERCFVISAKGGSIRRPSRYGDRLEVATWIDEHEHHTAATPHEAREIAKRRASNAQAIRRAFKTLT